MMLYALQFAAPLYIPLQLQTYIYFNTDIIGFATAVTPIYELQTAKQGVLLNKFPNRFAIASNRI